MLVYVKIIKKNIIFTDGQTDGQPKIIVRNLTQLIMQVELLLNLYET